MNNSPFLNYGPIRLLNIPGMDVLANECITQDCYQIKNLKGKWAVADIGACYGEFAFFAASLGHHVEAYEPSPDSERIAGLHQMMNDPRMRLSRISDKAVVGDINAGDIVTFYYRAHHPAGSGCPDRGLGSRTTTARREPREAAGLGMAGIRFRRVEPVALRGVQ